MASRTHRMTAEEVWLAGRRNALVAAPGLEQRVKAMEDGLARLKQEYERHSGPTHAEPDLRG